MILNKPSSWMAMDRSQWWRHELFLHYAVVNGVRSVPSYRFNEGFSECEMVL